MPSPSSEPPYQPPSLGATSRETPSAIDAGSVGHYENFPVASWLCPPALRPAVRSLYHFARTADDLADEGESSTELRLRDLVAYRAELSAALSGEVGPAARWSGIFCPLQETISQHQLPGSLLHDLLSAFEQDVRHTANGHGYADSAELLAYCTLSANPVGRLLLHLYGVADAKSLAQSDHICSALQLINFWQDIRIDHARGRHYLPADVLGRHGVRLSDFAADASPDSATQIRMAQSVAELCGQARALMLAGAPLARRVPGRAGWELRLVVQGGLRILDKIASQDHRSWSERSKLRWPDLLVMGWRAPWMH
jgi:squalene synthase HpnC